MEEKKFAKLDREQLEKINDLERKIGVTLIAYEQQVVSQGAGDYSSNTQEDHSS